MRSLEVRAEKRGGSSPSIRTKFYFRSLVKWMITAGYGPAGGSSILSGPAKVYGSVSEWFKVSVLKTDDCKRSVSSNLTASAKLCCN
jgi:hypothetical protein